MADAPTGHGVGQDLHVVFVIRHRQRVQARDGCPALRVSGRDLPAEFREVRVALPDAHSVAEVAVTEDDEVLRVLAVLLRLEQLGGKGEEVEV